MNILIAEDDFVSRRILEATLATLGFAFTSVADGEQAWDALQRAACPILITDYHMPKLNGFELTRRLRAARQPHYTYVILLTVLGGKTNHLAAIEAGVDDFLTKPFDADLLRARLHVAERIVGLRQHVKRLEGLLPICAGCKKIRDERDEWNQIESYISKRTETRFSHGLCPECEAKFLREAGLGP